jgi:hypothetical protein
MARKSKTRRRAATKQNTQQAVTSQRWRQKMLLGGALLVLGVVLGVGVRYWYQSRIPPRLQGAIENHYTRGVAGAPVVVKEFSDFT